MIEQVLTFGARQKLVSLLVIIVLTVIAAVGFLRITVDTNYENLVNENDPGWPAYRQTVKEFGSDNMTIIVLRSEKLWTVEKLALLDELTIKLAELEAVEKVESLFTALNIRDVDGSLDNGPLMDIAPEDKEDIAEIRSNAMYSPLISRNLLSEDGNATAINVTVARKDKDPTFNARFHRELEKLLEPLQSKFDNIIQIGPPRLSAEIESALFADLKVLTPLSTLVLVFTIIILLRTGWAAGVPLATSALSILWTLGFMGFMGIPLTILTAIIPPLVIVIGSTEDTHMLSTYLHGISEQKEPNRQWAVRYMARQVGLPLIITSFTTALGFFTNAISDIPLIREFAFASSFAMIANMVVTVFGVPLLLAVGGPRKSSLGKEGEIPAGMVGHIVTMLEHARERHGNIILGVTAVLMVGLAFASTNVRVSNDPLSYFKDEHQLPRDAQALHESLSGMQVFYLTLEGDRANAFRDPRSMKMIEQIQGVMAKQKAYDKTISIADFVALVNREMHQGKPEFFTVPEKRSEIDEYLLLLKRSDIDRYVTADYRSVNIVVRHNLSDSDKLNESVAGLKAELKKIVPPYVKYQFSGENLMINQAAESLFAGQIDSLFILIVIIVVIMSVLYTSLLAGFLSLVPNLIPVIANFGMMGLFDIPLNPATATVSAIAIGIAIDDTIHLMTRYAEECQKDPDQLAAVRATVRTEAVPVISTSVGLAAGFGILYVSQFAVIAQFGVLAAATMIYALLSDLLITPTLLQRVRIIGMWDILALEVDRETIAKSPLFRDMSPYQVKKTILLSQLEDFDAGDAIIEQGTRSSSMFLILSGEVEVTRSDDGRELSLGTLGPGTVFGEVGFTGGVERTATVRAKGPAKVMTLDREQTHRALRFYPRIAVKLYANIGGIMGDRLAETNRRLAAVES